MDCTLDFCNSNCLVLKKVEVKAFLTSLQELVLPMPMEVVVLSFLPLSLKTFPIFAPYGLYLQLCVAFF